MMGLPIAHLVVATNENDVLDEFFRTGVYRARKSAETLHTSSPSMDISKASNFERFVFDLMGGDGKAIDTHTADGAKVAREHLQAGVPMLVLETALPIKFEETIQEALGRPAECPPAFKDIKSKPQRVENIDADVNRVKAFITTHLA